MILKLVDTGKEQCFQCQVWYRSALMTSGPNICIYNMYSIEFGKEFNICN